MKLKKRLRRRVKLTRLEENLLNPTGLSGRVKSTCKSQLRSNRPVHAPIIMSVHARIIIGAHDLIIMSVHLDNNTQLGIEVLGPG